MTDTPIKNTEFSTVGSLCEAAIAQAAEPRKCKICGKPFKKMMIEAVGEKATVYALDCDCLQKKEIEDAKKTRESRLREKYARANIGKRYENITLEQLQEMGTEHAQDAIKFCDEFKANEGKALHLIGEPGNGKTSIGYATLKRLLEKGFNGVYMTWDDFSNRCYNAKSFNSETTIEKILSDLSRFDIVVLDEFVVNLKSDSEIHLAADLIDRWYRDEKSFILINNPCDIVEMKQIPRFGKLFDRVQQQAEKWEFRHGSYRRESKKN